MMEQICDKAAALHYMKEPAAKWSQSGAATGFAAAGVPRGAGSGAGSHTDLCLPATTQQNHKEFYKFCHKAIQWFTNFAIKTFVVPTQYLGTDHYGKNQ